jgi:hypothetical protein
LHIQCHQARVQQRCNLYPIHSFLNVYSLSLSAPPNELLACIVIFLDKLTLANIKLVTNKLDQFAAQKLFERVSLYAFEIRKLGVGVGKGVEG